MNYFEERNKKAEFTIHRVLNDLPPFSVEYFYARETNASLVSLHNYSYDLRMFFRFLTTKVELFRKDILLFSYKDLGKVTLEHIQLFVKSIASTNGDKSITRKINCLTSYFKYFKGQGKISQIPTEYFKFPKIEDSPIITLTKSEAFNLLKVIEESPKTTLAKRDIVVIQLFLNTGLRISELVGLDMQDVCIDSKSITVTRKGGNKEVVYLNDKITEILSAHIATQPKQSTAPLFKNKHDERLSARMIQITLKDYCYKAGITKNITPHKLRSTFATHIYTQTKDIYATSYLLGHADINTTKRYADVNEKIKRDALAKLSF